MASSTAEETDNKVPANSTTTAEQSTTTTDAMNTSSAMDDDDNENKTTKRNELHDNNNNNDKEEEESSSSPSLTNFKATTTMTNATAQTTTTTTEAATMNNSASKILSTTTEAAKLPGTTATTPTRTTAETNSTTIGTDIDGGTNNRKRKALHEEESSSMSADGNIYNDTIPNKEFNNERPTKRGRGRPRKPRRGPGRPRKIQDDDDADDSEDKIVFYAIRPGGPVIQRPIIFFGFKEFDFFHKCVNRKLESAASFSYRVCDSLVDALAYVGATDDPDSLKSRRIIGENSGESTNNSNKQRKLNPPTFPQQQQQQLHQQQKMMMTLNQQQQMAAASAQHQQIMMMRQQQQQQRMLSAQIAAATAAVQQQQQMLMKQQQQQKMVAAQAGTVATAAIQTKKPAAKKTNQKEPATNPTTTTTTPKTPNPAAEQPTEVVPMNVPDTATVAQEKMTVQPRPQQQTIAGPSVAAGAAAEQKQQESVAAKAAAAEAQNKKPAAKETSKQQDQVENAATTTTPAPNNAGPDQPANNASHQKIPPLMVPQQQMAMPHHQQQMMVAARVAAATAAQQRQQQQMGPFWPIHLQQQQIMATQQALMAQQQQQQQQRLVTTNVSFTPSPPAATTPGTKSTKRKKRSTSAAVEQSPAAVAAATANDARPRSRATTATATTTTATATATTIATKPVIAKSNRWEEQFKLLHQYKQEHGNCDVRLSGISTDPKKRTKENNKTLLLFQWVKTQREQLKLFLNDPTTTTTTTTNNENLKLTPSQGYRLMDLGFVLNVDEFRWHQKFNLLQDYKEEHGDCNIFKTKAEEEDSLAEKYKPLIHWGKTQQQLIKHFDENRNPAHIQKKKTKMTPERRKLLVDLGFPILLTKEQRHEAKQAKFKRSFQDNWEENFELLRQYKQDHGDCDVRMLGSHDAKFKCLPQWVSTVREQLKLFSEDDPNNEKLTLTEDQRTRLMDLGFIVNIEEFRWNQKFDLLREYKEEHGNCNYFKASLQQQLAEKYKPLVHWGKKQQQAILHFDENENPTTETSLMTVERRKLLVDLGFPTLQTQEQRFETSFQKKIAALKTYKEEHGTTVLPPASSLRQWLSIRRRDYAALQEGKPSPLKLEHIVALTSMGFSLTPDHRPRKKMKERVMDYVEFVNKHGRLPDGKSIDPEEAVLGSSAEKWSHKRRLHAQGVMKTHKYGKTEIPQELIDALDSVNFRWEAKDFNQPKTRPKPIPWEVRFEQLKKYKEKHGHCEPPKRHPKLGMFAFSIRQNYRFMIENKKSNLTVERFRKLSEIGFRFKTARAGQARKRCVDNDSSGYDTTSDEE